MSKTINSQPLRLYIKKSGKTYEEVANELGLTKKHIANYLYRETMPEDVLTKLKDIGARVRKSPVTRQKRSKNFQVYCIKVPSQNESVLAGFCKAMGFSVAKIEV